mgnify:CR=1 FL=1
MEWQLNGETVSFPIDINYTISVAVDLGGLVIKVEENEKKPGRSGLIYKKRISAEELGYKIKK